MAARDEFQAALAESDFRKLRRISEAQEPHLPRLSDKQAELIMHQARTASRSLPLKARAWSHRWLCERGEESLLPDRLRPSAEQICPRVALGVGLAVKTSPDLAEAGRIIRGAMEDAVLDAEAHGKLADGVFVRARILEARTVARRKLFGSSSFAGSR